MIRPVPSGEVTPGQLERDIFREQLHHRGGSAGGASGGEGEDKTEDDGTDINKMIGEVGAALVRGQD